MINLAIFSVESIDSYRYNFFLFNYTFKDKCTKTLYIYSEDDLDDKNLKLFKNHFKNIIVRKVILFNSNRINNILQRDKINFLIINSFTAADFRILNSIRDLNIFTLYVQHGLYLNYMRRNLFFFINNFKRVFSSLYYVIDICSFNFVDSYNFSMVYLNGKSRNYIPNDLRKKTNLNIVLSKYWKQFHEEIYKINTEYLISGYLDFLKFETKKVDGIVYCAQTLIEDGRIDKLTMLNFYHELYDFGNKTSNKIFIKTHPRNCSWTIETFQNFKFNIVNTHIPVGDVTIGHYSSLLPIWSINKCPILIFELKNHETPESILNISSLTIKTLKKIDNQTLNGLKFKKKAIEYFGDKPDQQSIINSILNKYENTILPAVDR